MICGMLRWKEGTRSSWRTSPPPPLIEISTSDLCMLGFSGNLANVGRRNKSATYPAEGGG
ncbi:hypothetical protein SLEP1_g16466 [Rubroshorea leprosula]|uniref:Uncharacterized protein n=1 Tax=Rubroshorea leprosula TaxID=152421 RepID=A0AAV5IYJ8_9ROSI|nr:hypothetical protein SLEP1_g16466 [Rubroshorea leprosula]